MALSATSGFVPNLGSPTTGGSTTGGASSAKAPTDPKDNKKWVDEMFQKQFWARQEAMFEKSKKQLENAMKGKGGGFTPL
jgi:hypothetical protein